LGEQSTVCAKVPVELKQRLAKLGVNVSEIIRQQLQSEVDRLEREQLRNQAKKVSTILKKIPLEEFIESVRATRESR
jgi:post-segregation antitoxin (ccd killing protein)